VIYKGFDNLDGFRRAIGINSPNALAIVLGFGLIHGFGLATRLQQVQLPEQGLVTRILAFNLGVELGRLAALVVMGWALGLAREDSKDFGPFTLGFLLLLFQLHGYLHGKTVLASYLVGSGLAVVRSLAVAGTLAITHVGSAVVLALAAAPILTRTLGGVGRAPVLEDLSRGLLALIGLWFLWRAWRSPPHEHREGVMVGVIAGLVPTHVLAKHHLPFFLLALIQFAATFALWTWCASVDDARNVALTTAYEASLTHSSPAAVLVS
jgi:hypothetical protein